MNEYCELMVEEGKCRGLNLTSNSLTQGEERYCSCNPFARGESAENCLFRKILLSQGLLVEESPLVAVCG